MWQPVIAFRTTRRTKGGIYRWKQKHTEQQIIIREVTHIQPSWAEKERGEPGAFTLQLVLDYGTEEYILRPTVEDAEAILRP